MSSLCLKIEVQWDQFLRMPAKSPRGSLQNQTASTKVSATQSKQQLKAPHSYLDHSNDQDASYSLSLPQGHAEYTLCARLSLARGRVL